MKRASFFRSKSRIVLWPWLAIALLISQATLLVCRPAVALLWNGIILLTLLSTAIWRSTRNALSNDRFFSLFWAFVAGGSGLWAFHSLLGVLYVTGHGTGWLFSPMVDGTILFLQTAMLLAAAVSQPHVRRMDEETPGAMLNSLLFLSFAIFVYVVLVLQEELSTWNSVTPRPFVVVYSVINVSLTVATATLALRARRRWRAIYLLLCGVSAVFTIGSIQNIHYPDPAPVLTIAAACLLVLMTVLGKGLAPEPKKLVLVESSDLSMEVFAMLIATVVPLFCVLELLRRNEAGNLHTVRLLVVLAAGLLFSATAFIRAFQIRRRFARDVAFAHDQLYLALQSGRLIAWDLDVATEEGAWTGDLETFFGIPARASFLPIQQFYRSIHAEDSPRVLQAISDARLTAKPFTVVFRVALPGSSFLWVKSHGRFYYNANGDPTRMLGVAVDINEQKQCEALLHQLRFRNVTDRAPVLLWMSGENQFRDYFNKSWLDFTGRSIEAELGDGWMAGIHPEDRQRYIQTYDAAFACRQPFSMEYRLRRHDGEYRWMLANGVPQFTRSDDFDGYIGSAIDVTEMKRADEELQKTEEEFRLAFEAAHLGWWVWNEEAWEISASEGAKAVFGFPAGSEVSLQKFLDSVHPEDRDRVYGSWRQAIASGSYFFAEYRVVWPDGTIHWLESRGRSYLNSQGKPPQMVGVVMEVTERKHSEETLRTVSGRLIAAQEEERARIARELHDDVCQRLAVVGMELMRMKDDAQMAEPRLQEWADQLAQLTGQVADDLQALSHELHSSKLEILGATATMRSFCAQFAEQHNLQIELTTNSVPSLPRDVSVCLYRILQEGLHNAAKHSRAERLFVELRGERGAVELTIQDCGVGFDPEKAAQGEGLGLISMRERVNLVKGTLSIESRPKRGTTIRTRVPVEEMNAAQCA